MKKILILSLFAIITTTTMTAQIKLPFGPREFKIVVIPSNAVIKVNGSYYGEGNATLKISKKDFVSLELSCPGYETLNTRIYGSDNRKTIEIKLKEDTWTKVTSQSGLANEFFSVRVSKRLYSTDKSGKRNTENAWKMVHNVLLNYFEEIQSSDMLSGFVQTPWIYKNYVENNKTLRTRVTIRESNIGGDLTFQIKVSSEEAPLEGRKREESFRETDRIMKEFDTIISEFQTRLGDK